MKSPPIQYTDTEAKKMVEEFIGGGRSGNESCLISCRGRQEVVAHFKRPNLLCVYLAFPL